MSPPSVDEFIAAAREFCSFAEDECAVVAADLWKVRELLLQLIYNIPAIENARDDFGSDGIGPDDATYLKVTERFSQFSFNYYRVVFDPHDLDANKEPGMGMLSDDLADIYRDLVKGLDNEDRGFIDEACFDWSFSYRSPWARHAMNALTAIELRRTDSYEIIPQITKTDSSDSVDYP